MNIFGLKKALKNSGLQFAAEKCVNFASLALVDDDIFLDVPKVTEFSGHNKVHDTIICLDKWQGRARAMRRGKWAVSWQEYGAEFYPKGCSGSYQKIRGRIKKIIFQKFIDVLLETFLEKTIKADEIAKLKKKKRRAESWQKIF